MNVELRKDKVARIGSELHQIYTYSFSKISLSPLMTKGMYWMTKLIPWLMVIMLYQSNLHMLHNLFHRCVIVQGIVGHLDVLLWRINYEKYFVFVYVCKLTLSV